MTEKDAEVYFLIYHMIEKTSKKNKNQYLLDAIDTATNALKEIQQYREIGTVEEFKEAVDKQQPKKILPIDRNELRYEAGWRYKCPNCGCAVRENIFHPDVTKDYEYCSMCGQAILNDR